MKVFHKDLKVTTLAGEISWNDITEQVREALLESSVTEGVCVIQTAHATCSVTIIDETQTPNEGGTNPTKDNDQAITCPHTVACHIGYSETVIVRNGALNINSTCYLHAIDFDLDSDSERTFSIMIMGA
ncbi:hypothetical protein A6E01_19970 (plasmid) [Vibrio breoganii]|uniref:Uncharacterized protein n=1 Tax=Vibrio breoganii TaxID=553239 RepID=A0AAN0XZR4_9VIBR|nr:YjbQ family protein [Vibrio breoganii]ANO35492.1 hypothetical protein A6E01_19970 [Vibrio breoganii]PML13807.1 hypothetical protein BCT84_12505 [Vibrio breoganii]